MTNLFQKMSWWCVILIACFSLAQAAQEKYDEEQLYRMSIFCPNCCLPTPPPHDGGPCEADPNRDCEGLYNELGIYRNTLTMGRRGGARGNDMVGRLVGNACTALCETASFPLVPEEKLEIKHGKREEQGVQTFFCAPKGEAEAIKEDVEAVAADISALNSQCHSDDVCETRQHPCCCLPHPAAPHGKCQSECHIDQTLLREGSNAGCPVGNDLRGVPNDIWQSIHHHADPRTKQALRVAGHSKL